MEKEAEKNIDYEYHKNGKIERTIEKLEDGGLITSEYSERGKLISTREEKENSIINKEYYRSGILKSEENYSRVKENGEYHVYGSIKEYHSNGNLEIEMTTVDSLYHGEYKKYHSNGVLEHERAYENGKALNNFKFYKENGKLEYDHEKAENSLINKLHSFIFKKNKEKENLEEKNTRIWKSYTEGASPQDLVYKEIEERKNEINEGEKHQKYNEKIELDKGYREYYDNGNLKLEYGDVDLKEYYESGQLKSTKEFDKNLNADGTWQFFHTDGSLKQIEVYAGGELLEVSKKEYGTTEIGFVHYVYNGYNEVQRKEYAPNEDEYIKIYYEEGGAKDIYHERDGMTFYIRRNENNEIVAKGQFDEEMKKVGDWVTLDKTNTPTNVKTYHEDILIKEVNYKNGILNGPMREYDKGTEELISEKIFKGGAEEKLMETLRAAQPLQEKSQEMER